MNYNRLNDILQLISDHTSFLILIHDKPDGDALGSGTALALFLKKLGKESAVLSPCPVQKRLEFIQSPSVCYFEGYDAFEASGFSYDFIISVDVASDELIESVLSRLPQSIDLAVDHHRVNTVTAAEKYVDAEASATGEILFSLFSMYAMITNRAVFDQELCEALYASISSDTGCFKYSNTTAATHDIAAKLLTIGIAAAEINRQLFDSRTRAQIAVERLALSSLQFFYDGRLAIVAMDLEELAAIGATDDDTDTISQLARMIEGVQIGVLMREKKFEDGSRGYKFSVRSNVDTDISALCAVFGGGGHKKAAGCAIRADKKTALEQFTAEAENYLI